MAERERVLDVSERRAFRTIYEGINWSVGTNYKYWGRACWPRVRPNEGFRLWFTQLAYVERGRFVPATFDCINLICCNGNYHVFDKVNPKELDSMAAQSWKYDLIFSKEVGKPYYFRGVFISDSEHSAPHHYVSKRVATRVKLIGCPARRLELLDYIDAGEFDENYMNKHVVSYDVVEVPECKDINAYQPGLQIPHPRNPRPIEFEKRTDDEYEKLFPINCRVKHSKLGTGTVKSIEDGIITIHLDKGLYKSFSIDYCLKNRLLNKL